MLQHWASEGKFYTGGFVLCNFIEPVTFAHCVLYILEISHWADILIHVETFRTFTARHTARYNYIYIGKFGLLNSRGLASLAINFAAEKLDDQIKQDN